MALKIAHRSVPGFVAEYRKSHRLPAGPLAPRTAKEWRARLAEERAVYLAALQEKGLGHLAQWEDDDEDGAA